MAIDKRRFRANFHVEWENQDDPFYELSLVARRCGSAHGWKWPSSSVTRAA